MVRTRVPQRRAARLFVAIALAVLLVAPTGCKKRNHSDAGGSSDDSSSSKKKSGGGSPAPGGGSGGGAGGGSGAPPAPPTHALSLLLVDETGTPIPDASVAADGGAPAAANPDGSFALPGLVGPTLFVASAPGFLDEPFVLDASDAAGTVTITLRTAAGPGGARLVLHFGGDVMLGRRYLAPESTDTPVVVPGDGGASARAVVGDIAPLMRAAHLSVVNLETVVGSLPESAAYPRKRFLIQSPPETVDALDELGVDLVTLGNNHVRDWLDAGLAGTMAALDAAGVAHVGAGPDAAAAALPRTLTAAGYDVAFLSYCSITGDSVNDAYPLDGDAVPPDLDPGEAWQYEFRSWGFAGPTSPIATADRRLGSAWVEIQAAEAATSDAAEIAALWASATAVYPELQDWLARRGHGGANPLSYSRIASEVAAAKAAGADIVVVALHSGHQYSDFKSTGTATAARTAVDAGADLVVCHHPHTLEGFEFYKGKLIAWSLGNCVFDQDFLATFSSGVLRVVLEGTSLLEARFLPATVVRYRPAAVAGRLARDIVRAQHERSTIEAASATLSGAPRAAVQVPPAGKDTPRLAFARHAAVLSPGPGAAAPFDVTAAADGTDLPSPGLFRSRDAAGALLPAGILFGRDLLLYGSFEDDAADGASTAGLQWDFTTASDDASVDVVPGAPSGSRAMRLHRVSTNTTRIRRRPVARATFVANRLWTDLGGGAGAPLDGPASYSVRLRTRADAPADARVILDVYHFDDANPTEDPTSDLLRTVEYSLPFPADGSWHDVLVDIPAAAFDPVGADSANSVMLYIALYPPASGGVTLYADDVQLLEWREAALLPDFFFAADAVRSPAGALAVSLQRRSE